MSDLIGHAKALRALARAYQVAAGRNPEQRLLPTLVAVHDAAADDLEQQMRDGASGPAFETDRGRSS